MTTAEAIAILKAEYGYSSLLDNLKACDNELKCDPMIVSPQVERAFRKVCIEGRKMFAPA